jgi:hypothetical protein
VPASGVRRDGWTVHRRILFVELLEEHGSILSAARAVGMSRRAVYRLLPRAPAFAAAFEATMARVAATLDDTLFDRALHGHEVPILYKGDVVATRTVHHDMLGLHLLRVRDPLNYAPPSEGTRWLAGHGLKPIGQQPAQPALPGSEGPKLENTPVTGDLCDLRDEQTAPDTPPTGDLSPAGLDRVAAGPPAASDRPATPSSSPRAKTRGPASSSSPASETAGPPIKPVLSPVEGSGVTKAEHKHSTPLTPAAARSAAPIAPRSASNAAVSPRRPAGRIRTG